MEVQDSHFPLDVRGRQLTVKRELGLPGLDGKVHGRWSNMVWDESRSFIQVLYPTLLGIKGV